MTPRQFTKLREELGYSQERMAEELDVHRMTISKWERGLQPMPKIAQLAALYIAEKAAA